MSKQTDKSKPPADPVRDAVRRIGKVYDGLSANDRKRVEAAIAALYPSE